MTTYGLFDAAGRLPRTLYLDKRVLTLTVKGLEIDNITIVGESKDAILVYHRSLSRWLSIAEAMLDTYHNSQSKIEAIWRTLITDTAGNPPECPAPARLEKGFRSWMDMIAFSYGGARPEMFSELQDLPKESTAEANAANATEYGAAFTRERHLRLFLTRGGYLGVGSKSVQVGDSIWLVAGSHIPLTLRPECEGDCKSGKWRLVGGTYLHGEALHGKGEELFQPIIIQ